MLSKIYKLGGDVDTIGAMAGAIWGAFNGIESIDQCYILDVENSSYIIELAEQIYELSSEQELNLDEKNRSTRQPSVRQLENYEK
jgi:hypothetical protein